MNRTSRRQFVLMIGAGAAGLIATACGEGRAGGTSSAGIPPSSNSATRSSSRKTARASKPIW